jgi:hypothetical protein
MAHGCWHKRRSLHQACPVCQQSTATEITAAALQRLQVCLSVGWALVPLDTSRFATVYMAGCCRAGNQQHTKQRECMSNSNLCVDAVYLVGVGSNGDP